MFHNVTKHDICVKKMVMKKCSPRNVSQMLWNSDTSFFQELLFWNQVVLFRGFIYVFLIRWEIIVIITNNAIYMYYIYYEAWLFANIWNNVTYDLVILHIGKFNFEVYISPILFLIPMIHTNIINIMMLCFRCLIFVTILGDMRGTCHVIWI